MTADTLIRLQYSTTRAPTSAFIRWFSNSDWSHVDVVMPEGGLLGAQSGRYGAIPAGVQIRPDNYETFSRTLRVVIESASAEAFHVALRQEIGKPFDWTAVLSFIVNRHRRDWRDDRSWFCSQLLMAKGEEAGVFQHRFVVPSSSVTPATSLVAFNALPGFRTDIRQATDMG